jgi:hypothetical protein
VGKVCAQSREPRRCQAEQAASLDCELTLAAKVGRLDYKFKNHEAVGKVHLDCGFAQPKSQTRLLYKASLLAKLKTPGTNDSSLSQAKLFVPCCFRNETDIAIQSSCNGMAQASPVKI